MLNGSIILRFCSRRVNIFRKQSTILSSDILSSKLKLNRSVVVSARNFVSISSSAAGIPTASLKVDKISDQLLGLRGLQGAQREKNFLKLEFVDGTIGLTPFLWLRDNCQCSSCFDSTALGRKSLLQDININVEPVSFQLLDNILTIDWNDDHQSIYQADWLHERAFTSQLREHFRYKHKLEREPWGKGISKDTFEYSKLKSNDEYLLKLLMTLERKGISLVNNSPDDVEAGASLIDHIAFCKQTHFGRRSPVVIRETPNNVAQSGAKLGLHNDLTQYDQQPGLIFLQMVKPHEGRGGESIVSDGLFCMEILRKRFFQEFRLLSKTPIYFLDKGLKGFELELGDFHKITKHPIISLDKEDNLEILRVNNQKRDSFLDLQPEDVFPLYRAMKIFTDILYEHSHVFKMVAGDILILDNIRCLHGRESYSATSDRHIETSYLDWDEVRCKRRRLQTTLLQNNLP